MHYARQERAGGERRSRLRKQVLRLNPKVVDSFGKYHLLENVVDKLSGDVFCLEVDFEKSSPDPDRVFRCISSLISAFQVFDANLANSIDSKIEPVLLLEDVEGGSIKTWLTNTISQLDDEALKSGEPKKILGQFLVRAKYIVLDWLNKRTKITSGTELEALRTGLLQLAKETDIRRLPSYVPIQRTQLLQGIESITRALEPLSDNDRATFRTGEYSSPFNLEFSFVPEEIEELITSEKLTNVSEIILKVKKPDYLGDSMWEFRHGRSPIIAKITHLDWLRDFQERKFDVRPGDSIRGRVEITVYYDFDQNPITTKYNLIHISEVIRAGEANQENLPLE